MPERFFDIAHDMLCVASLDGRLLQVNDAWTRTLGWEAEELCSGTMDRLIHPDDVPSTQAERARLSRGGPTLRFRNRYRTHDGGWRWLEWRAVHDSQSNQIFGAARDVTDEVAAQRGMELRQELLNRMIDDQLRGQERDQQHYASELHDSVVQHLAAAIMYLETAEAIGGERDESGPLHRGIQQVRASLKSVRMVMQGLDPFDLGDLDLRAAIVDLGEELGQQYSLQAEIDVQLDRTPPATTANVAYRVIREAFVNAGKHAGATTIRIRVRSTADALDVEVGDDGRGFPPEGLAEPVPGSGLGLPTMRERVRTQDGQMDVQTSSGGTSIRVTLPLAPQS